MEGVLQYIWFSHSHTASLAHNHPVIKHHTGVFLSSHIIVPNYATRLCTNNQSPFSIPFKFPAFPQKK